jgi:hypothetical protein
MVSLEQYAFSFLIEITESTVSLGALQQTRASAKVATEKMAEKMREVERLREMKKTDERERSLKVSQLTAKRR